MMKALWTTLVLMALVALTPLGCDVDDDLSVPDETPTEITGTVQDPTTPVDPADPADPSDPTDPADGPEYLGAVQASDGTPAAGVWAILIDDTTGHRDVVETSATGGFTFADVSAGEKTLIVNDFEGNGNIRHFTALGSGLNDIGSMFLFPLEGQLEVFDMIDVGFEEKLTEDKGDRHDLLYSSDASFAVTFRRLPGSSTKTLVIIDTATGEETELFDEEKLGGSSYTLGHWYGGGLVDDRWVVWLAVREDETNPEYNSEHHVYYDLETGLVRVIPNLKGTSMTLDGGYDLTWIMDKTFVDGTMYYIQRITDYHELYTGDMEGSFGCWVCGVKVEACAFELASGERTCVALNDWDEYQTFDRHLITDEGIYYQVDGSYSGDDWYYIPGDPVGTEVKKISFDTMTKSVFSLAPIMSMAASPSGESIYLVSTPVYSSTGAYGENALYVADAATGEAEKIVVFGNEELDQYNQYGTPMPSPTGSHVALRLGYATGSAVVDVAAKTYVTYPTTFEYNGVTLSSFYFVYDSEYAWTDDGSAFVLKANIYEDEYEELFGEAKRVVVYAYLPVDGGEPTFEEFDYLDDPQYYGDETISSADGSFEASIQYIADTGFDQVFVSDVATGLETQLTFITAQHSTLAWAPDGVHLLYTTRDPVSGYEHLFRVNVASFLDPSTIATE